jgi:LacI family transcriptional regulator
MTTGRRPTQREVARLAGVSQAVVSYVLNDVQTASVAPETRERVLAAIAAIGYVPDGTARSLRSRKSRTIAAIIPDITNPFYPEFIRGIQDACRCAGFDVLIFNTDGERSQELAALDAARRSRADGVIITPFFIDLEDLMPLLREGTPVTSHGEVHPETDFPLDLISISGENAAKAVVDYLLEQGHTRIGMISGLAATLTRESRVRGYRRALSEHHVPLDEVLIRGGDFTEHGGYEAMIELAAIEPRPTAVFAANDLMAMGALLACRELGIRVPDDIALAGFDDIPAARLVHPTLTTLNQHAHASGVQAAETLLSRLNGTYDGPGRRIHLTFTLVPRDSA